MSSTTIRHSGVHENTQSAAHLATGHPALRELVRRDRSEERERREPRGLSGSDRPPQTTPREPAHLHHRPGDDWEIGARPHDPDDPGPYGTPGWYQDRRTGRHRRGELPDPLPERGTEGPEGRSPQGPEGFSRMQEDAYRAFLRDSEELHLAHYETAEANRALVRLRWMLHVLLAILYWRVLPFPERPAPRPAAIREADRETHRAEPKRVGGDAYRPKRAAGRPLARTERRPERAGRRPGARPGDRAAERDGRRPTPGPRGVERRRPASGPVPAAGAGVGVGSAPQAFFAAVRSARDGARVVGGMEAAGGAARGEAL